MVGEYWAIDAGMSEGDGVYAFCPIDLDSGDVILGLTMVSSEVPPGGSLVAVMHPDGDDAAAQWTEEHREELQRLTKRAAERVADALEGKES